MSCTITMYPSDFSFWLTLCFHELVRGSKSFNGKNVNVVVRYQFLYLIDIQIDLT